MTISLLASFVANSAFYGCLGLIFPESEAKYISTQGDGFPSVASLNVDIKYGSLLNKDVSMSSSVNTWKRSDRGNKLEWVLLKATDICIHSISCTK